MKKLFFIFCTFIIFNMSAQTIFWGAGSSNPLYDDAGRFASAFGSPNGWTANGVSSTSALWTRTTNGLSQGAYATGLQAIGSPSELDGAALFDSDFLDNNGVIAAYGTGTCPAPHKGELISPSFDLTGNTNIDINAKMFLFYKNLYINELSVGFSSDGGSTWTDFSISQGVGTNDVFNAAFITVPLSNVLDGVTNLTDCKLRLTFDGEYYFAMIDDISIELSLADISIASPDANYDFKTSASPAPFKTMPLQIAKSFSPYNYAALVKNNGGIDIPLTANPLVHYDLSKNVSGTWTSILSADVALNNPILGTDTISVYGDITTAMQAAFTSNGTGDYRFMYIAHHDLTDATTSNDSAFHYFTITPDYSWYSSSQLLVDGGPAYTSSSFPGAGSGNVIQELEWGTMYYFPDTTNIAIDSVKYRMKVPADFNLTNQNVPLSIKVSEWNDINTDQIIDANSGELILKTQTLDTLTIANSDLNTYVLGNVKITDPFIQNPTSLLYDLPYSLKNSLKSNVLYYISVSQSNNNGLRDLSGIVNCLYPAQVSLPYEWSLDFSNLASTPLKVTEGVPGGAGNTNWYSGYSGSYITPSIALSIIDYGLYLGFKENKSSNEISIFPNPTSNTVSVNFNSEKESSFVRYILTDETGRVLFLETHKNIKQETYSMDVSKLPAGNYYFHINTDSGNISKPFVKH